MNRSALPMFALLIIVCAAYRVIPYELRPEWLGAPQLAMAVFAGSVLKSRKWSFAVPLFSMLISDLMMQGLHLINDSFRPGFYDGQLVNYLLILSTTVIGFFIRANNPRHILAGALAAPVIFFLLSNFQVWLGGHSRPATFEGLMQTYIAGLPFLKASLFGTLFFSALFFGMRRWVPGFRWAAA